MGSKVTFLFTDLEESTRQWERHADAMRGALERHDVIMQSAIDDHGGTLVKHTGDGVCAAFADAAHAASACIAAQRALQLTRFDDVALRSRMAIYTGIAERQGSDYRGAVLNRVARLMAAAHGGQVLVSQSAREEIGDRLPPGAHLRDMGVRRLKDVVQPEQVFQLVVDGLPCDFPPLRSQDARRLDVPAPTTEFIGREREIDAIAGIFRSSTTRLLTLTGAGGTGKSRLAIEAARRLVDDYDDGAIFVSLASVVKPGMVVPAIARALGVREDAGRDIALTVCEAIRGKKLLLVLDNFEQIVDAAPVVSTMLEAAPGLHVLVTSRERLHLSGEREYAVEPLALPQADHLPAPDALARIEAVALFVTRAQAVQGSFTLDAANAADVAHICCRLDGLPLAIELAAARVRILTPARIRGALDDSLHFLTGGARNAPERHRTLRATIEWSHAVLTAQEQALFRRMAVFAGGATLEAIEVVCRVGGDPDVLPTLESLVAKSLVRQTKRDHERRFSMLETIAEYAREHLAQAAEAPDVATAHAEFFAALAEEAAPHLNDVDQAEWLARLDAEDENLRAALAQSAHRSRANRGLRLCKSLHRLWSVHGRLSEGRRWCTLMLQMSEGAPASIARIATGNALAVLALHQNDYDVARPLLEECAASLRAMGELRSAGRVLNNLGVVHEFVGELEAARASYEESLAIKRETADPLVPMTLGNVANVVLAQGDVARARAMLASALEEDRKHGSPENLAITLCKCARAARKAAEFDVARGECDESIAILRRLDAAGPLAEVLEERGSLALDQRAFVEARAFYVEALTLAVETGNRGAVAAALEGLATIAGGLQAYGLAARHFAAAAAVRAEVRGPPSPLDGARREAALAEARRSLGNAAFEDAWRAGAGASLAEAVEFALHPPAP